MRSLRLAAVLALLVGAATACGGEAQTVTVTTTTTTTTTTGTAPSAATTSPATAPEASLQGARSLQASFEAVVAKASPNVVQIATPDGLGSGVVFDEKGNVVTNAHVVGNAQRVVVTTSTGKTYRDVPVVGTFTAGDLAVVRVNGGNLRPAQFADSSKLRVGEIVLALGNPLGLRSSVTQGIVSALSRTQTEETGATLPDVIQTSAAINPGNSGGALVDLDGRVVGIPTLAAGSPFGGAAPGIGFAIPSNTVVDIAGQIAKNGKVVRSGRAYIGIQASSLQSGGGVLVARVAPGSGAARAGLRAGDVITAVDGNATPSLDALGAALAKLKPGQQVRLSLEGPRTTEKTVTLGELPGE